MNEFALYLVKSACWLSGFTIIFLLFLRNERFFRLKRIFLISGILASLLFPLVSFHYQVEVPAPPTLAIDNIQDLSPSMTDQIPQISSQRKVDLKSLLLAVYVIGMVAFTIRMFYHLYIKIRIIKNHNPIKRDSIKIIRSSEFPSSFSFFNYIFINPSIEENEFREILNHELVHVTQKHWLDLVLAETLSLLQWANPLVWIYTGFIRLNHEYIADEVALQQSSDPTLYKAALLNHIFRFPVISLSNSFNYSLHKSRFEMMKNIINSPYRKLKVLLIIPVFPVLFYTFAVPQLKFAEDKTDNSSITLNFDKKDVFGVVINQDGKPFPGVQIAITGTNLRGATDSDGKFHIAEVPEESRIIFSYRGYLTQVLKPQFSKSMTIQLDKDPDYKPSTFQTSLKDRLVVIDDVVSDKPQAEALKDLDMNSIARMSVISEKTATDKYGEKGKNGAIEIMTLKRATELGIKIPFRRRNSDDYPTFQGENYSKFANWLAKRVKYPADASSSGIKGRVTVNFEIQPDGTLSSPAVMGGADKLLGDAVLNALKEAPKWEPAKNPESKDPFRTSVTLKFELPDKVLSNEDEASEVFVVVEQMPTYPGGDLALMEFINKNLVYPERAKAEGIQGRVILRFVVNKEGNVEDPAILKGVHPLLDAEAIRVVNLLKGWSPGYQGGRPVNVWYSIPITFALK